MTKFLWGVATSAAQYEAGLDNDWTVFATTASSVEQMKFMASKGTPPAQLAPAPPAVALRHDDPLVFGQDIERAKALQLNAYRLSLEWSRLEPTRGEHRDDWLMNLYIPVLRQMRAAGIEPVVTLHHLTNPRWVLTPPEARTPGVIPELTPTSSMVEDTRFRSSLKGWESAETVDAFVAFVGRVVGRIVAEMGAQAPTWWITLNEPIGSMIGAGYIAGIWSPGFCGDGQKSKAVYENVLKAHVRAYLAIKALQPNSMVSVAQNMPFSLAKNPSSEADRTAAVATDYFYAWHSLNAWHRGTYDPDFQPDPAKRLVKPAGEFFDIPTAVWEQDVRSTLDFVGVNYYRSWWIERNALLDVLGLGFTGSGVPSASKIDGESAHVNDMKWRVDPQALLSTLLRIRVDYNLPVLVTENGMADADDLQRPAYLVAHAGILSRAQTDGVDVRGYLHWSIVDNWEWQEAYLSEARFGLYTVDRIQRDGSGNQTLPRRLTESAIALTCLASGMTHSDAVARFGTFSDDGADHVAPVASSVRCWQGDTADGVRWRLMLVAPLRPDLPPFGWLWDSETCRWCALGQVTGSVSSKLTGIQHIGEDRTLRLIAVEASGADLLGTVVIGGNSKPLLLALDRFTGTWHGPEGTLVILPIGEFEKATPVTERPTQPGLYVGRWLSSRLQGVKAKWMPVAFTAVTADGILLRIGTAFGLLKVNDTALTGTFAGGLAAGSPAGAVTLHRADDGLENRPIISALSVLLL